MGIIIRQGFKGTIVIYLGVLLGAFNLLWLFPKYLKPEEIGLMRVLLEMGALFALFSQFGASNITDKFFTFFKEDKKKHQGFLFLILLYSTIGFVLISVIYVLSYPAWIRIYKDKSPLLLDYLYYVIPLALFMMYLMILEAYSRVHMRIVIPSVIRDFFLRVAQTVIVILYFDQFISLKGLVILLIISYLVGVIFIIIYLKQLKRFYLSRIDIRAKKDLLKEILRYGIYIFMGSVSGLVASKIDIMMVSSYSGLNFAGIYSIAFFMGTIIEIPRRPISGLSSPLLAEYWKNNDREKMEDIYKKSSINQLIVGLLLLLLIWTNIDYAFQLMPNSETYAIGKYVVLFIGLAKLIEMGTGVTTEIIVTSPFFRVNLFLSILSGITIIGLNYFFIPIYGINGAALAILINYSLSNLLRTLIILVKYRLQPFTVKTLYALILAGLTYVLTLVVPDLQVAGLKGIVLAVLVNSTIIGIFFFGLTYFFRISDDLNKTVNHMMSLILKYTR